MYFVRFGVVLFLVGCAQFGGMESESKKGLIPDILLINIEGEGATASSSSIKDVARSYVAETRAESFQAQVETLPEGSPLKEVYSEKAEEARQRAMNSSSSQEAVR